MFGPRISLQVCEPPIGCVCSSTLTDRGNEDLSPGASLLAFGDISCPRCGGLPLQDPVDCFGHLLRRDGLQPHNSRRDLNPPISVVQVVPFRALCTTRALPMVSSLLS